MFSPGFRSNRRRALIIGAGTVLLLGAAITLANRGTRLKPAVIDVLPAAYFQLDGVRQGKDGQLTVTYTGDAIVNQNGSPHQTNPPVNLYGTRLRASRGFRLTYTTGAQHGSLQLGIYGRPPLIEDEFRAEMGSVTVTLDGTAFTATVSDQKFGNNARHTSGRIAASPEHTIMVTDESGELRFQVDGRSVGKAIADDGSFAGRQVWLGFNAGTPAGSFQVTGLRAEALGGTIGTVDTRRTTIPWDPDGLAALAQRTRPGFIVGAAVAPGPLLSDPDYRTLLGNYNGISVENVGKWQFIHPRPGNQPQAYDFTQLDALVALARQAGMTVHGHALLFGEANPAWLQAVAKNHPEQMQQLLIDHVTTVVSHYAGRVDSWDVINEPLADYDQPPGQYGLRRNIWYDSVGPEYLAIALRAAHAADPHAGLWLNDFGMESDPDRFATMLNLAKQLRSQGVPLTGVGFQSHFDNGDGVGDGSHISRTALAGRFAELARLGLQARLSELDVSSPDQYAMYGDAAAVCLAAPNCTGLTTWGVTSRYSSGGSLTGNGLFRPASAGLPWTADYQPTAAVQYLRRALAAN